MSTGGIEGSGTDYPYWREASTTNLRRKGPDKNVAQDIELDGGTLFGHEKDFIPPSNNLFIYRPIKSPRKS
ncbi:hypothetical protein HY949_02585 [Candidatus Gottesmanbacteria bacterium]|nr:hypothetical protein [Candidatus Gottesmanbacteria bacterium]